MVEQQPAFSRAKKSANLIFPLFVTPSQISDVGPAQSYDDFMRGQLGLMRKSEILPHLKIASQQKLWQDNADASDSQF